MDLRSSERKMVTSTHAGRDIEYLSSRICFSMVRVGKHIIHWKYHKICARNKKMKKRSFRSSNANRSFFFFLPFYGVVLKLSGPLSLEISTHPLIKPSYRGFCRGESRKKFSGWGGAAWKRIFELHKERCYWGNKAPNILIE